jgi:hypothetical protein
MAKIPLGFFSVRGLEGKELDEACERIAAEMNRKIEEYRKKEAANKKKSKRNSKIRF